MNERADQEMLRDVLWRLAALEDTVTFLELWCEEQQDALDRVGEAPDFCDEDERRGAERTERAHLYVVDGHQPSVGEETDSQRQLRQIRARLDRLRNRIGTDVVAGAPD
jgi:hypothetical protein